MKHLIRPGALPRRAPSRSNARFFGLLASSLAASVIATTLVPIAAVAVPVVPSTAASSSPIAASAKTSPSPEAQPETPVETAPAPITEPGADQQSVAPANEVAIIPTPDGGHSYAKVGGTEELDYHTKVSFADLPKGEQCDQMSAWVLATDSNGKSSWANLSPAFGETDAFGKQLINLRLNETGMRYPGGELTLTYFGKKANDSDCSDNADPSKPEDTSGLASYKTTTLNVDWQRPTIKDVYYANDTNGDPQIRFEVDQDWPNFDAFANAGGLSIFHIEKFGDPRLQRVRTAQMPCVPTQETDRDGLTCSYNASIPPSGDAIGVAALPAGYGLETVTNWPPVDAIDYKEILSNRTMPVDPQATQAGSTDSADCLKLCAGDPVDTYNGNFYERIADLQIDGPIGLEATRRYAVGLLGTAGAHGDGWALNYDMRVEASESGNGVTVIEPSGNLSRFFRSHDGYTSIAANLRADLTKTADGWAFSRWDEDLTHVFNSNGVLTSIRDDNGNVVTVTHDSDGRVSSVTEGDRALSFVWNDALLTSVEDHTGRKVSYGYTSGRLTSVTDPRGNVAEHAYDGSGRVLAMTNESGGVTTNVYDAEGRISQQTQPSGQVLDFAYGNLLSEKYTNTVTSGDVVKTYVYDKHGRILSFSDTSDPTAKFSRTYDTKSNVLTETLIDRAPRVYTYTYSDGNRTKSVESRSGSTVLYEYDAEHRVTATVDAAGIRTESAYDDRGNLVQTKVIPTDGSAPRLTSFEIDENGNTAAVVNPLGGRTVLEYDAADQLTSISDPVGGVTTNSYDPLGRPTETVSPGGNVENVSAEDKKKFTTSYTYDDADNVLAVADQSGTTSYQYDEQDRPTKITDPRGKIKNVTYDPAGQPTKITYPDGSADEFGYDLDTGLRSSWKDPQGLTTTYSYDKGAVTTTSPDGTASTVALEVYSRTLDTVVTNSKFPSGLLVQEESATQLTISPEGKSGTNVVVDYDASGRMARETKNSERATYAYDGFGQLKSRTGQGRDVSYEHDLAGNVAKTIYADGTEVLRETDVAGRTTGITSWDGTTYDLGYTAGNQLGSMSSSTGLGFESTFDGSRLTSKTWKKAAGAQLKSFGYQYEASGLMSADRVDITERDFSWNDNGALASINQDPIAWDGRHLTSTDVRDLVYESATGRLAQATEGHDTTRYEYDAQGNRTKSVTGSAQTSYTWNGLNQLTKLDDTAFSYGADGIRIKVGSAVQNYNQDLKLLSDGEMKYLWAPDGSLLAQAPLGSTGKADTQQAVTDALGSVHSVLDQQLSSVGEYSYTVFGERTLTGGADASSIGFASEQHDDSGLIYLRYRYLDPTVGQFISVDPLVGLTLDPYGYASGNPLQMTDPLGLFSESDVTSWFSTGASWMSMATGLVSMATAYIRPLKGFSGPLSYISTGFAYFATINSFREGDPRGAVLNGTAAVTATIAAGARALASVANGSRNLSIANKADTAGTAFLGISTFEEICK